MTSDKPIILDDERRIKGKIKKLALAIESKGDRGAFEANKKQYLEQKANMSNEQETFNTTEIAEMLDVTQHSVWRWINNGELKATKMGRWRVTREDLSEFWKARGNGELFEEPPEGNYLIKLKSGYSLGTYPGDSPAEALAKMHRANGYNVRYDVDNDQLKFPDEETKRHCGGVEAWDIESV